MKLLVLVFLLFCCSYSYEAKVFKGKFNEESIQGRYIVFPNEQRFNWDWEKHFFYKNPADSTWIECGEIDWYPNGLKVNCNFGYNWDFKIILLKDFD